MEVLLLFVVVALVFYWASLHLHPFTRCPQCRGTGRHRGAVFGYATRACGRCGGTSRVHRLGVRLFLDADGMKYRR